MDFSSEHPFDWEDEIDWAEVDSALAELDSARDRVWDAPNCAFWGIILSNYTEDELDLLDFHASEMDQ